MAGSTGEWFDGKNGDIVENWVQIAEERGLDPDILANRELLESPNLAAAVRAAWSEKYPTKSKTPVNRRSSTPEEA